MIFGGVVVIGTFFVFLFDFAYLRKTYPRTVWLEGILFFLLIVTNFKGFFLSGDLYSDGGYRIDLVFVLVLIREAILGRVERIDGRKQMTNLVRSIAIDEVEQFK